MLIINYKLSGKTFKFYHISSMSDVMYIAVNNIIENIRKSLLRFSIIFKNP